MANSRLKERFELALDVKQIVAVLVGSLVILGGTFVLGMSVGRQAVGVVPQATSAPRDALARLDEPLPAREEPAPDLKAHQALTDARPIDKTLPVPQVKPTTVSIAVAAPTAAAPDPQTQPAPIDPVLEKPAPPPPSTAKPDATAATPARSPRIASAPPRVASKPARPVHAEAHRQPARRGSYAIQVGSVTHRADAERLARKLSARNPRIVAADVPGKGHVYRVLVGAYDSQDAAKRQLASLSRAGVHGIVTAVR